MSKKYSVEDTLYFFYFGITLDELENDDSLEKVVKKALFDATMQGAFNSRVKDDHKENARKAKNAVINTMLDALTNKNCDDCNEQTCPETKVSFEDIKDKKGYDDWHKQTCCNIKKQFEDIKDEKENEAFTYGNAQKVVNMTMKYLYLLSKSSQVKSCKVLNSVKKKAAFLHMPIDSYIIDALFENNVLDYKQCKEDEELKELVGSWRGKGKPSKNDNVKKWSRWDYNLYRAVQNQIFDKNKEIGNEYYVIDWENDLWIEQAKNRSREDVQ